MVGLKEDYENEIDKVSNQMELHSATRSRRVGKGKIRDMIVFTRLIWGEAFSFISPLQTVIIFAALITPAVITTNAALYDIQARFGVTNPFQFPIDLISYFAAIGIVGIFIFGLVSVRYAGTYRSSNEYSAKMNPGFRLLWEKEQEILKRLESLEKKLK